jgi:hypothetical protein
VAQVPANPKLYAMIVAQAKAKYASYPSPGASHWVHSQYINHGGQFVEGSTETAKKKRLSKQFEANKRKHLESKKKGDKKDEKK